MTEPDEDMMYDRGPAAIFLRRDRHDSLAHLHGDAIEPSTYFKKEAHELNRRVPGIADGILRYVEIYEQQSRTRQGITAAQTARILEARHDPDSLTDELDTPSRALKDR